MAPAASILAATSAAAAASSKRQAASDAEQLADSSAPPQPVDDEASRGKSQPHPNKQEQLPCPRCRSTNTKFCYYNNYSTAQPRHFCRACRRYWTHGGTLRDVPVGGATRRGNKRRRVSAEPLPHSAATTATPLAEDDLSSAAFPFLSDGSYYLPPQIDHLGGLLAPAAWPPSVFPDFFDGLAPWDVAGATTGAWSDENIAGLELTWPPPGN